MADLATRLLAWFEQHGRRDLPWQHDPTPYRVWVSEIMLQQTQVETVRAYYQRFMARFPRIEDLAAAAEDQVLGLWSGLGYYARARNLHAAARRIAAEHGGVFPSTLDEVMALPGIGRSTAAAILVLSQGQRHAILDGNVKRVLSRHGAIAGWPGRRAVEKELWARAEACLPRARVADYTQAMMDLGATVCLPRSPSCTTCPLAADCLAHGAGNPEAYPEAKPRKTLPVRETVFLVARRDDGAVLLERRPPSGIWGGLWCFPECKDDREVDEALARRALRARSRNALPAQRHSFSHFHLEIRPLLVEVEGGAHRVEDNPSRIWRQPWQRDGVGLAAAVVRLLENIESTGASPDNHGP